MFSLSQAPTTGCIPKWNECSLVGWMRDGFPVYSYCRKGNTKSGAFLKTCYEKKAGEWTKWNKGGKRNLYEVERKPIVMPKKLRK